MDKSHTQQWMAAAIALVCVAALLVGCAAPGAPPQQPIEPRAEQQATEAPPATEPDATTEAPVDSTTPAATGAPAVTETARLPKIKLGVQPWLGYGPWWVAEANKYFEKYGLEVEVVDFTWDQDMNAALASDNLDVMCVATNTFITLLNQGVDVQAFLLLDASYEADAIIGPTTIKTVKDLKGKQVAYEAGSTSELLLTYALDQNGMTLKDVEPILMAAADAGAAMIAGRVAVAVTYEPYISAALAGKPDFGLLYTAAEKPGLISDVMIAKRQFILDNPAVFRALALAWDDAITYLREKPEEGGKIIADAVGSPMEEFEVAWRGVQVYDLEENREQLSGAFKDTFTTVGTIMTQLNPEQIKTVPDPAKVLVTDSVVAR